MIETQPPDLARAQDAAAAKRAAQHSSKSNEHYTPSAIVEAARELMGGIDFDPFSCSEANRVVKARAFCSLENGLDGFSCTWSIATVPTCAFVNPPGGKLDRKTLKPTDGPGLSSAAVAWAKLIHEWKNGNVIQAVFVGFNLEILRTSQGWKENGIPGCGEFPICFPDERLRFWNKDKAEDKSQPTCANVLVYVPPYDQWNESTVEPVPSMFARFERLFSKFGTVKL